MLDRWIAVGFGLCALYYAIQSLRLLPTIVQLCQALAANRITWPGPPVYDPDPRREEARKRLGLRQRYLFPEFLKNSLLGVVGAFVLSTMFGLAIFFWWPSPIPGEPWIAYGVVLAVLFVVVVSGRICVKRAFLYMPIARARTEEDMKLSSRDGSCSIVIPDDWVQWTQRGLAGPDVLIAARSASSKWPNLEVTRIGKTEDESIEDTKRFAHRWAKKERLSITSERFLEVALCDAYEFTYWRRERLPLWRKQFYCKVCFSHGDVQYLIQLCSRKPESDKPLFDECVQSFSFSD